MNKIFKVIYSRVKNCYVVTSELAKAHTKSSTGSKVKHAVVSAALAAALVFSGGTPVTYAAVGTATVTDKSKDKSNALIRS